MHTPLHMILAKKQRGKNMQTTEYKNGGVALVYGVMVVLTVIILLSYFFI